MELSAYLVSFIILLSSFCEYTGTSLFPGVLLFQCLGRIAFPLCCYLIASKVAQDGFTWPLFFFLFSLAVLSEIPFDQLRFSWIPFWNEQNPVFALVICVLLCGIIRSGLPHTYTLVYSLVLIILSMLSNISYGWLGPALSVGFLLTHGSPAKSCLCAALLPLVYMLSLLSSGFDPAWVPLALCMSLSALPVFLFRKLSFASPVPYCLLGISYPLEMLFLIWIRNRHLIPPYFFD